MLTRTCKQAASLPPLCPAGHFASEQSRRPREGGQCRDTQVLRSQDSAGGGTGTRRAGTCPTLGASGPCIPCSGPRIRCVARCPLSAPASFYKMQEPVVEPLTLASATMGHKTVRWGDLCPVAGHRRLQGEKCALTEII